MRCSALAREWTAWNGRAVFLVHCDNAGLYDRIASSGIECISLEHAHPHPDDLISTLETLDTLMKKRPRSNPAWVVLDGYHFDPLYQSALRSACRNVLIIDDTAHHHRYHALLLLNQNPGSGRLTYRRDPDTQLLAGPSYALLRPEFGVWREWTRAVATQGRKVLVTLGFGEDHGMTASVLHAIEDIKISGFEVRVVVGAANPRFREILDAAERWKPNLEVLTNVADMAPLMAWADAAVSAAGSTCWELAFMGLPCVVVTLADNQAGIAKALEASGCGLDAGGPGRGKGLNPNLKDMLTGLLLDPSRRAAMSAAGRVMIDGRGAKRVVEVMARLSDESENEI
jgi:UDP-2,4-diacetamido-2,4,6-trideoxy-beta-L-altropyranose hydrolase